MRPTPAALASVIIRSMDPPTLHRALDSVALQDYPAIEVVLAAACGRSHRPVDAARYPFRLTFVESDEPLSRPRAANVGLGGTGNFDSIKYTTQAITFAINGPRCSGATLSAITPTSSGEWRPHSGVRSTSRAKPRRCAR
jgi:hypothetical protein